MLREIEARKTLVEIPVRDPFRKIILPNHILKIKASFPQQTRVIVSEGIFDLLHDGHRTSLFHAKAQGDVLFVLVGTDAYARKKGEGRPRQLQTQRLSAITDLDYVDYAIALTETIRVNGILEVLQPDLFVKGIDKRWDDLTEFTRRTLKQLGINVAFLGDTVNVHTTDLIRRGVV